jgi:hypothetical protein
MYYSNFTYGFNTSKIIFFRIAQLGTHSAFIILEYLFGITLAVTIPIVSIKESKSMSPINANHLLLTIIDF